MKALLKDCLSQAMVMWLSLHLVVGNPVGESVWHGAVGFERGAGVLTVRQDSALAIIEWSDFSIGGGERTVFVQPGPGAIALNRVTGGLPSQLDGDLLANGQVWLVNPQGVFVGAGGRVEVAGFLASTREIAHEDFLGGHYYFVGDGAGGVRNAGEVRAGAGGVTLVGREVQNVGTLWSAGEVRLLSGTEVWLESGGLAVVLGGDGQVQNAGLIEAATVALQSAHGNPYALAIGNSGTVRATGVSLEGGRVLLEGPGGRVEQSGRIEALGGDVRVEASSLVASGTFDVSSPSAQGGQVWISGQQVSLATLDASGLTAGGHIVVETQQLSLAEALRADSLQGKGGTIRLTATETSVETVTSSISVNGATGGLIRHVAGQSLITSGDYQARGHDGTGGYIGISAPDLRLLSTQMDATGTTGGGILHLGGQARGLPGDLPNAVHLVATSGSKFVAEAAGEAGDGGAIVLWADQEATILGSLFARPGTLSGEGGNIELSAGERLRLLDGIALDASRPGRSGTVLIDPKNIIIGDDSVAQIHYNAATSWTFSRRYALDNLDNFGGAVALDGTRLVVGAPGDSGLGNTHQAAGAAYLFTFSDSTFTTPVLQGIIGKGYVGGKNINLTDLESGDRFGGGLALYGNRLAVGAFFDDGAGNAATDSGAVYLFGFADASFTSGTLHGRIGKGYTGGSNYDLGTLDSGARLGQGLALGDGRLAVGAPLQSGAGAVHLFTFAGNFSGLSLVDTLDQANTGGTLSLASGEQFGRSVAIYQQQLAVGAPLNAGYDGTTSGAGAVHLFSFTGGFGSLAYEGTIGRGYTGGASLDVTALLDAGDQFGSGVALQSGRLGASAQYDAGFGNSFAGAGAVHLFSFTGTFGDLTRQSTLGRGYTGSNDYDVTRLDLHDGFGSSLAMAGNRVVVGANRDDGADNASTDSGAAYLFTYSGGTYGSLALAGMLGNGYSRNSLAVGNLEAGDLFGTAVSLYGNRLVVGAPGDDGFMGTGDATGAAYLFSFADVDYHNPVLHGIIGKGYTGGRNLNIAALENNDRFGQSVSIFNNRIAVGALWDDGAGNAATNAGAVYLFSFSGDYESLTQEALIGKGYAGGKNYNLAALEANDVFGRSVSLYQERLAVGAPGDGGADNAMPSSGAVYLFSFTDKFSDLTLQSTLGYGYSGGKNLDVTKAGTNNKLDTGDSFGNAVSLFDRRLAVGAPGDDGFGIGGNGDDYGAVYLFTFGDMWFSNPTLASVLGRQYGNAGGKYRSVSLDTGDRFGESVSQYLRQLAVGIPGDDGQANDRANVGAVRLFTFTDNFWSGGLETGVLGRGYTGTGSYHFGDTLDANDGLGRSVALWQHRLVAGANGDAGATNASAGAGAVYLFSFANAAMQSPSLVATFGEGYVATVGRSFSFENLTLPHARVALGDLSMAVGFSHANGVGLPATSTGIVRLYTFDDTDFTNLVLRGTIGRGFSGGGNYNLSQLDPQDRFGHAVALYGTQLAVGAPGDDGATGTVQNAGAVYLFSFANLSLDTPTLRGTLGHGYQGAGDLHLSGLEAGDEFGHAVALYGTQLAASALRDAGLNNDTPNAGAVRLFTFADNLFAGASHVGTLGRNYVGGNNLHLALDTHDFFGSSLGLYDRQLAVGAIGDDGRLNDASFAGAVHMFTFADNAFTGATHQGTLGYDYAPLGGKHLSVSGLSAGGNFGQAVALNNDYLVVSSLNDAGFAADAPGAGAVRIWTFADNAFSGGALSGTIGKDYTGTGDYNLSGLTAGQWFGVSLGLFGDHLVVADYPNPTQGASDTVSLWSFDIGVMPQTDIADNLYNEEASADYTFSPATLTAILNTGTALVLQANNDILVQQAITVNNAGGDGGALTLQAGRSIFLNANLTTDNGALTLIANDLLSSGVQDAHRDAGAAVITMAAGTTLNTGTGQLNIFLRDGSGKTHTEAGNITLRTIATSGAVAIVNSNVSGIVLNEALTGAASITLQSLGHLSIAGALSTTNGNIVLAANTSGAASGNFAGIQLDGIAVSSGSGSLSLTGIGGNTGHGNHGIALLNGASLESTSGAITLTGTAGAGTSYGIYTAGGANLIGTGATSGDLSFLADTTSLADISVQSSGALTFAPLSDSTDIAFGMGASGTGLVIGSAVLAGLVDGFSLITIGSSDGTGTLTVTAGTYQDPLRLLMGGSGGQGTITTSGDLVMAQAGDGIEMQAGKTIYLNGNITTLDGAITLGANADGMTTGAFHGLDINGRTLSAGAGAITLTGVSGDTGASLYGIRLSSSSALTTTSGAITLSGKSRGTSGGRGILLTNAGTAITTQTGALLLSGESEATGSDTRAVAMTDGTSLTATGAGHITITGTATGGSGNNRGVVISGTGAAVTLASGNLVISGTGASGTGGGNHGVYLFGGGSLLATGAGNITLDGVGGASTTNNIGVFLLDAGTTVSGAGGLVTVLGQSLGTTTANMGVSLSTGATITNTGAGAIAVTGSNAVGTSNNIGVNLTGAGTQIATVNGDISLAGNAGSASAQFNHGVQVRVGALVRATGSGSVTLHGTAGQGTSSNYGVFLDQVGAGIQSNSGNLILTGIGRGSLDRNFGMLLSNSATVSSTSGNLTVQGFGGSGVTDNFGINLTSSASITGGTGDMDIQGIGGAASGSTNMGVYMQSASLVTKTGAGALLLTGTGGAGTIGNAGVRIDGVNTRVSSAGTLEINGSGSGADAGIGVHLSGGGIAQVAVGGGSLTVNGTGTQGLNANYGVYVTGNNSAVRSLAGNDVEITGTGRGSGASNHGVYIQSNGTVSTTGTGRITLNGIGGNGTSTNVGVYVHTTASGVTSQHGEIFVSGTGGNGSLNGNSGVFLNNGGIAASGTGAITINGNAGTGGTTDNRGVHLSGASALISAVDGNITVTATGRGTTTRNRGLHMQSGSMIRTTGTGTIGLTGTGGTGGSLNHGIFVEGSTIQTTSANLSVTGYGGMAPLDRNYGVYLSNTGIIQAGAAGHVTVTGVSGNGHDSNRGVFVETNASRISAVNGNIQITGTAQGTGASNYGVWLNGGSVTATGAGSITIDASYVGAGTGTAFYVTPFSPGNATLGGVAFSGAIRIHAAEMSMTRLDVRTSGLVTLDAAATGSVSLTTGGIYAGQLELLDGAFFLGDAATLTNQVGVIAVDGASVDFVNAASLAIGTAGATTGVRTTGTARIRTHGGAYDLTIAHGALLQADTLNALAATQRTLVLSAARHFVNQFDNTALDAGNGIWAVYTSSKAGATLGGYVSLEDGGTDMREVVGQTYPWWSPAPGDEDKSHIVYQGL